MYMCMHVPVVETGTSAGRSGKPCPVDRTLTCQARYNTRHCAWMKQIIHVHSIVSGKQIKPTTAKYTRTVHVLYTCTCTSQGEYTSTCIIRVHYTMWTCKRTMYTDMYIVHCILQLQHVHAVHVNKWPIWVHILYSVCTCVYMMYMYMYMCTSTYTCTCTCVHLRVHVHVHVYIYVYMYMYMYMNT